MLIVVGTNSWITLAEANTYLTTKLNAEDWFSLTDDGVPGGATKENYIVTAFNWLRSFFEISADSTDTNVKNAQAEACYYLMKYSNDLEKRDVLLNSGVTSFERSEWQEDLDINNLSVPSFIGGMLGEYSLANVTVQLEGEDYK